MVQPLRHIIALLNQYLKQADGVAAGSPDLAKLGNIARWEEQGTDQSLENHVVATLVNIQEESALRNGQVAFKESSGSVTYRPRPLHVNAYLLFTALFRDYDTSLRRLEQVMTFFQQQNRFNTRNATGSAPDTDYDVTVEFSSLTFEQVNYLWGNLGGKIMPCVMYKARLMIIDGRLPMGSGTVITEEALDHQGTT